MTMVGDPKSLVPYISSLVPGLKDCLVDPIPDVRATCAKALGALVAGVGEEQEELAEVMGWLLEGLCSDVSPVERSGAAQGLAEVCVALGDAKVVEVLAQTMPLQHHSKSSPREGLLWLLSFLPAALKENFGEHISSTLPVILAGLSDENDGVREVAMRAGQIVVSVLGFSHTQELIPSICDGMFDDEDWRIRLSSVTLLGELLYMIGDAKAIGMADGEEDDEGGGIGGSARVTLSIRAHLGDALANTVFASLYIVRSDLYIGVRQSALQVWKSVVSNTPRTLVEIMGEMVRQVVEKLSSESADLRLVAGRALGEVVKKLGDRVLPIVMPHMRSGLRSDDIALRQGVCLGLAEILSSASVRQVEMYIDVLVQALQAGLCDGSEEVRAQAAKAFQSLFKCVGVRSIEEVRAETCPSS